MKKSKLITVLLVIVMTLGMAAKVLATPDTATIEIKNTVAGNQLEAYQILSFQVTTAADGKESYNQVSFIDDGYKQIFIDTINQNIREGDEPVSNDASPTDIMLYITNNFSIDSTFANELGIALETYINANAITAAHTMQANGTSVIFKDLAPGYYLILDKTNYNDFHKSEVAVMVQAVGSSVSVDLKTSTYTTTEKEVNYENVQIGDELTYTVSFNIPNFSNYKDDATFIITDTMSAGLTLVDNSFEYTLGGTTKTFTAAPVISVTEGGDAGTVAKITIPVKENFQADDIGKTFTITYKAKVNSNADIDNLGNAVVSQQNGYTIPEDVSVDVYSYGIKVLKINEAEEKLKGVEFVLLNGAGEYYVFDVNNKYSSTISDLDGATKLITDSNGEIKVFGLKAGTYYLREIKTLDGYNLLTNDVAVVIEDTKGEDYIAYKELTVKNTTKIQLPGTGGMGTAAFRITGTVLLLAGGFLFSNRKKCSF